ncbi:MAG: CotH kinase family protein, partial [Clostridia bacterium]|nr:CotH kinase family protein [Clostridia bacterium]
MTIICYSAFAKAWLAVLTTVMVVVLAGLHLLYVLNYRNKKSGLSVALIILGILLAIIGNSFVDKNPILFFIMMCLSEISLISALVLNAKFSKYDIFYMLAITIPMLLLVNLSPMFGYANAFNRILVSFLMILASSLLGLSISHLIRKHNAFNISFSIVVFFNLIYILGLIILKQSNVTHQITPIINIVFYILLLLFSVTILFIDKDEAKPEIKVKRNVVYSVSILLVTMLIGYTIVSNFMAFNFVSAKIYKEQFLSMVGDSSSVPIVEIHTQDNEEPQNKVDYVNCSFEISNCENEEDNFSVPMTKNYEDEGCVGIRLRGNSTMKARKRPYRIKFDEKQSFFGLKANKSWVLLADYYDQSYIRNYTAFTLADKFDNLDFTPTPHHVALVINNEFKGLYLLCEQMDEKKGRANVDEDFDVAVDKEFPFLIEMDLNAYKEGVTGIDNFYVESVDNHVEIKYPEADERQATETSDVVYDYIYEYVNAVFTTIKTNEKVEVSFRDEPVGFEDLVDIDSAVDYYLVNEIMQTTDNPYKSIYFHKTKDGKMEFGPVWDFDFSMTTKLVAPYDKSYIEDSETLWIAQKSAIYQNLFKNEAFY